MPSYGSAGESLQGAQFTNASNFALKGAAAAERRTAAILVRHAATSGVTALHDLDIPKKMKDGRRPNIDHILVIGKTVWIIDTKWWKPGFYWTAFGRTRRGMAAFPPADKQTMAMAADALREYLSAAGVQATIRTRVVVWPSSTKKPLSVWAARMPGSRLVTADSFDAWVESLVKSAPQADPAIVVALVKLLKK